MIQLHGDKMFALPVDALFAKLTDLQFLVTCLPDVKEVKRVDPDRAELTLRPKLSFVAGELALTIEKQRAEPPGVAEFLMKTKGIGSSADVRAVFNLNPTESAQTQMSWTAAVVQLGGLLKAVPHGLIQAAAQRVINDVLAGLERQLQTSS